MTAPSSVFFADFASLRLSFESLDFFFVDESSKNTRINRKLVPTLQPLETLRWGQLAGWGVGGQGLGKRKWRGRKR